MLKYFVLFFMIVCVYGDWNDENYTWTVGSAVNITVGQTDVQYCKVTDNNRKIVFDGLGPCRIVLDKVTMDHKGRWTMTYASPDKVMARSDSLYIDVVHDSKPAVSSSVERNGSSVVVTCSVPVLHQVKTCIFSDPRNKDFIASTKAIQDNNWGSEIRYESYADQYYCTLRLLMPDTETPGRWRCTVYTNTTQAPSYGFFDITRAMMGSSSYYDSTELSGEVQVDGESTTLSCSIRAAIRYCYFRAPDGTVFNVSPSTSLASYEYVGRGFDAGECGIKFNNFPLPHTYRLWSCNVGLVDSQQADEEKKTYFVLGGHVTANYFWRGNHVVVYLKLTEDPMVNEKVEYCRFVRGDGLSFTSFNTPFRYITYVDGMYGACALFIQDPTSEYDVRSWTIIVKKAGKDEELSMTTTWEFEYDTTAIILWSVFGSLCVLLALLAVVCLLPKRNREWTYQRVSSIRKSFRRQPQTQPLNNATNSPIPGYTQI